MRYQLGVNIAPKSEAKKTIAITKTITKKTKQLPRNQKQKKTIILECFTLMSHHGGSIEGRAATTTVV